MLGGPSGVGCHIACLVAMQGTFWRRIQNWTVRMAEDGARVASGGVRELKLWNCENRAIEKTLNMLRDTPAGGALCTGGGCLIISTALGKVQWGNASSGQLVIELEAPSAFNVAIVVSTVPLAHAGPVKDISVSLDCALILTQDIDREAKFWDRSCVTCTGQLGRLDEEITTAPMSADGLHVVTGNMEVGLVWRESGASLFISAHNRAHDGMVLELDVSQDGSHVISLGR